MEALPVLFGVTLFLIGIALGSFLNVVIARLPKDESIVRPRSHCPACGQLIRWYDNVPILSFFLLGRRCRDCRAPISWRYPLVEALSGALLVLIGWRFGPTEYLAVYGPLALALVAITFIDIDHRIIPNEISLPGIVVGFACSFIFPGFWKESLLGILIGGGVLFLLALGYSWLRGREGMGMGDVKLLAMLGAFMGWRSLLFIVLFASLQGVVVAIGLALAGIKLKPPLPEEWEEEEVRKKEREQGQGPGQGNEPQEAQQKGPDLAGQQAEPGPEEPVPFFGAALPFGPFLALAAVEYLFFGAAFFALLAGR